MSLASVLVLALGLAMDATAVAGARGVAARRSIRVTDALRVAVFFGGFQAAMPAVGWALGEAFATRIVGWSHWVVFVVLAGIGGKMLHEALGAEHDEDEKAVPADAFGFRMLALLAVATSIDALAAGITLALAGANVVSACAIIGVVTGVLSFAGVYIGHHSGRRFGKPLEVLGGLVLIALAVKALVDHFRA
ncbi:MAG: hypothetical protein JWP97_714 [Labilithrix sp.]|nr:hypothetical protein [Labilithrix sp.]